MDSVHSDYLDSGIPLAGHMQWDSMKQVINKQRREGIASLIPNSL